LKAGLILGPIWTVWHIPAFLFSGIVGSPLSNLPWYALGTVGLSLLMTALIVRTRGSVLIAGILPHFVINGLGVATGGGRGAGGAGAGRVDLVRRRLLPFERDAPAIT